MTAAGVRCEAHQADGMFHVFPFLLPWARESKEVYVEVGVFIADIIAKAGLELPEIPMSL